MKVHYGVDVVNDSPVLRPAATELPAETAAVERLPFTVSIARSDEQLAKLFDSPLRREILKRLTGGQTAVWLMIDSGDADAVASTLAAHLAATRAALATL